MLSALGGSLMGLLSGLAPDLLKLLTRGQEAKSELQLLRAQQEFELGKAEIDYRREEMEYSRLQQQNEHALRLAESEASSREKTSYDDLLAAEDHEFTARQKAILASIPTLSSDTRGQRFINGFNAVIRPALATLVMLVAIGSIVWYLYEVATLKLNSSDLLFALENFWAIPLVETVILSPLAFLFTSRQVRKRSRV